jgi:hypothetical protein
VPGHDARFHALAKKVARGQAEAPAEFANASAEEDFLRVMTAEEAKIAAKRAEEPPTEEETAEPAATEEEPAEGRPAGGIRLILNN